MPPPHNSKPESFAELVNLLDPTAIADPANYLEKDIAHLYVRRHRNSPDVGPEVAHNWQQRAEPHIQPVEPTPAEHAVLRELNDTWVHPAQGHPPVDRRHRLGDLLDRYEPNPDGKIDPAKGFIRPDREAEMRAAYAEFDRRLVP